MYGGQKRATDLLELELYIYRWLLAILDPGNCASSPWEEQQVLLTAEPSLSTLSASLSGIIGWLW